LIVAKKNSLKF